MGAWTEKITAEEIITIVLQNLNEEEADESVIWAVKKAEDIIKGYCCLSNVPPQGKSLWLDLALDLVQGNGESGGGIQGAVVSSASMGDVSYTFVNDEGRRMTAGALRENYRHRLNQMRRGLFR